jgi:hypothetical protein
MKNQQIHAAMTEIRFADIVVMSVVKRDLPRSTHVPSKEASKRTERLIVIPLKRYQQIQENIMKDDIERHGNSALGNCMVARE